MAAADLRGAFRTVVDAMAMPFTIDLAFDGPGSPNRAEIEGALAAFHRDLIWADDVFSLWRDDTPLSRLARGEIGVDDCPPAVAEVFDECERFRVATDGFFDAHRPDGVLDPTGLVKTWAVVRAAWRLDALGATGWMIGASGDAVAAGTAPGGGPWVVGIADPRNAADPQSGLVLDAVALAGGVGPGPRALATSGTAQHGEHIWNPRTGVSEAAYVQVSVAGDDLVECDAWATAIVAGGAEVALAAQRHGLDVLCVEAGEDASGSLRADASPGWPSLGGL